MLQESLLPVELVVEEGQPSSLKQGQALQQRNVIKKDEDQVGLLTPVLSLGDTRIAISTEHQEWSSVFSKLKKEDGELKELPRNQKRFYTEQNELIDTLLEPLGVKVQDQDEKDAKVRIAINLSLAVNILLFSMQITAALISNSLALIATSVDAFMDLLSGAILLMTERARNNKNPWKYPIGKSRMEPVGIVIFSSLMSTVSIQLFIEGAKSLVGGKADLAIGPISIALVVLAIGAKVLLYLYCRVLTHSPTAMTLATDHRNDIVVNSFGISMALLGNYVVWWLDPTGALLVAAIILRSWGSTAYEQIELLVGKGASPQFLQRLTYIAMCHSQEILKVDTVRAYNAGTNFFVEVDVVLPRTMPLEQAHDIGESLQIKLEEIAEVERAFVHLDYEYQHKPEHKSTA